MLHSPGAAVIALSLISVSLDSDLLECDGSVAWSDESNALFYVTMDDTYRPYKLYRRQVFNSDGQWIGVSDNQNEKDKENPKYFTELLTV